MTTFFDVAFGADPGRWPLPSATTADEHWQRAVAAGGQGRYAAAFADLDVVIGAHPDHALTSLALSTKASFLRQLGGHVAARTWDGRAWAAAGGRCPRRDVEASTDALIGLAADALGVGRFAASAQLLRRADDLLDDDLLADDASGRLPIRLAWVSAELAMVKGEGASAVRSARHAVTLADGFSSARHAAKSQVVLAAALCSAGEPDASRVVADKALVTTERLELVPLSWALACLLADVGSAARSPSQIAAVRDTSADVVRHRGGTWTAR